MVASFAFAIDLQCSMVPVYLRVSETLRPALLLFRSFALPFKTIITLTSRRVKIIDLYHFDMSN